MAISWGNYAAEAKPSKGGFSNGLETLPDAVYNFEIEGQESKDIPNGGIVAIKVVVIDGPHQGHQGSWDSFITDQASNDRFLGRLESLGFEVSKWEKIVNGVRDAEFYQDCVNKALVCLKGLKFSGKKKANPGKSKGKDVLFQNIEDVKRLADGVPEKIDLATLAQRAEELVF